MVNVKHITVYSDPSEFAGWPANHGAWQWGDEFLVGFIRGKHNVGGMHNVIGNLQKVQARSLDGGESWVVEVPNVDFEARSKDIQCARSTPDPGAIIRVCGRYDHGGENCAIAGGFYESINRGRTWEGPWSFSFLDFNPASELHNTSRTCVLDQYIFLTLARRDYWGSDFTVCCLNGQIISFVRHDGFRAAMPAAARLGGRMVVALRRRGYPRIGGWIDTVYSDDQGLTWSAPALVMDTGKDNGNPPAIIELNGRLYCASANRSEGTLNVMISSDGEKWLPYAMLRKTEAVDIGYPRLFKRRDGQLVCVYYWADNYEDPQRIEATIFNGER